MFFVLFILCGFFIDAQLLVLDLCGFYKMKDIIFRFVVCVFPFFFFGTFVFCDCGLSNKSFIIYMSQLKSDNVHLSVTRFFLPFNKKRLSIPSG